MYGPVEPGEALKFFISMFVLFGGIFTIFLLYHAIRKVFRIRHANTKNVRWFIRRQFCWIGIHRWLTQTRNGYGDQERVCPICWKEQRPIHGKWRGIDRWYTYYRYPTKTILCRIGFHKWKITKDCPQSGEERTCQKCGKVQEVVQYHPGFYGSHLYKSWGQRKQPDNVIDLAALKHSESQVALSDHIDSFIANACPRCKRPHPTEANYCRMCGVRLISADHQMIPIPPRPRPVS